MDINIRQRDGVVVVELGGRIIGPAGGELRKAVDGQLAMLSGPPKFLFDFANVSRMDSSGLGTLVGLQVSIVRRGGRVGVINVGTSIKNLLVMGKLLTLFERFESEDEAVAALAAGTK